MKEIYFPNQYKKALLNKTKNVTLRVGKELGKYKKGEIYSVKSYAGTSWNIKIKVVEIVFTKVNKLFKFGIPTLSIKSLQDKENLSTNDKVEVIKFEVL